jgi:hypothetical protein
MKWFQHLFGGRENLSTFPITDDDISIIRSLCLESRIRVAKIISPAFFSSLDSSVKIVHVIRHPMRVINSLVSHKWIRDVASYADRMCNETMVLRQARPDAFTVFADAKINKVALQRYVMPNDVMVQAALVWEKSADGVDAHTGKQYHGPRSVELLEEEISHIVSSDYCSPVVKMAARAPM